MPEMHLRQPGLHIVLVGHLHKSKKESKNRYILIKAN